MTGSRVCNFDELLTFLGCATQFCENERGAPRARQQHPQRNEDGFGLYYVQCLNGLVATWSLAHTHLDQGAQEENQKDEKVRSNCETPSVVRVLVLVVLWSVPMDWSSFSWHAWCRLCKKQEKPKTVGSEWRHSGSHGSWLAGYWRLRLLLLWILMGYYRVAVVVVVDAALLDTRTIPSSSSSSRNYPWEIPDDDKDDKTNGKHHHTQKQKQKQPNGKEENREVEEDDDENDEEEQQEDEEEEEDEDDEDEEELWTEHERMEDLLSIEFSAPMDTTNHHDNTQQLVDEVLQGSGLVDRLQSLLKRATTMECRTLIAQHYGYLVAAVGREHTLPFAHWDRLESSCPRTKEDQDDEEDDYDQDDDDDDDEIMVHPDQLQLLYVILTHDDPQSTIRLIQTLSEPKDSEQQQPQFVIHVDGKPASDETFAILSTFAEHQSHVHVVPDQHRVRVTWGGFGMVQATLVMLQYAFGHLSSSSSSFTALDFDKVIHLSGSTYPIASNREIRHVLSHYPLDSNFMHIPPKPCKFSVNGIMWTLSVTHISHKPVSYILSTCVLFGFYTTNLSLYTYIFSHSESMVLFCGMRRSSPSNLRLGSSRHI